MSLVMDSNHTNAPGIPVVIDPPIRVLVVDDEPALRRTYEAILTDHGCKVRSAENGRRALQVLMQQGFDVMVVDLRMDEMDGMVFLQEALRIWPWIGVVIVSAYVTQDVIPQAAALGVTRILEKPATLKDLCDNVDAEAMAHRDREVDIPRGNALDLMRGHLKILADMGSRAIGTDALMRALSDFGASLGGMMPSDVVGILVIEDSGEAPALLLEVQRPVSREFLKRVEAEMLVRFVALSGKTLQRESLNVQFNASKTMSEEDVEPGSTLSVPVILDSEVCGLVTLAAREEERYSPSDVSLLYHAANHISAVFMALRRMHRLATRDSLTGIFNRIRFEEELERTWLTSRRYSSSMGVVVVDIDNFKTMNDSYGHTVGDEILRDFAQVMQSVSRSTDVIARYGGDEFTAILPRADEEAARTFGSRLLKSTRDHVFCEARHRLHLTISVGIATSLNSTRPSTGASLLSQADRALYIAKRAGRNRMCVWPGKATATSDVGAERAVVEAEAPAGKAHILVVDDEPSICSLARVILQREGYQVTTLESAEATLEAIHANSSRFDILLTDIGLPDKSGIEILHEVTRIDDKIVKIVMTGNATVDNAVSCLREGAYDFIEKPIGREQLTALIERALEYRQLRLENAQYQMHLEEMVTHRSEQLASSLEEIKRSYEFTLEALVAMLDAREHQTGHHSIRTRDLAVTLAQKMGLRGEELEAVAVGALLHDIGKIGIRDDILLKPGRLLPEEWADMRNHPEIGYRILRSSPYLRDASKIVRQHQEHYDGTGYPRGLKGEEICIGARVFGAIDAYDAMRSARVYRDPVSPEEAAAELRRHAAKQFDPEVVRVLLECQDDLERVLDSHAQDGTGIETTDEPRPA